jgi:aryl-alcohol dehydrogenase-like predicted oxidoreductase
MQYRSLGRQSPLQVSALCLGTMMFADQTALAEARSIVDHAAEHGVNFIDTADVYSLGGSERMASGPEAEKRNDEYLAWKKKSNAQLTKESGDRAEVREIQGSMLLQELRFK